MGYATLYIEEGNLLGFYDDLDAARVEIAAHVEKHPDTAEEFGVIEINERGERVGEFVSAGALARGERPARHGPRAA